MGQNAPHYKINTMKVKFLKPWRNHKAGEVIEADSVLYKALIDRKIAVVVKDTKEEKRAYTTKKRK